MAAPAPARAPSLPGEAPLPGVALAPRLVASGVAVLLHGGLAGLLLLVPAIPPSPAMPELVPVLAMLAEPVAEESPAPAPAPAEEAAAAPDTAAAPIEETPAVPFTPDMPSPEPVSEAPATPASEPVPEAPPPPAAEPPLPELPAETPPPRPEPRPAPRPRPVARRAPARSSPLAAPATNAAPVAAPTAAARAAGPPPSYLQALAAALERRKRYPQAARARRAAGTARLRFTVTRDGRVARWHIEHGTGDADLDRAVAEMIAGASLPAMPADMPGDSLEVAVPVRFHIR